jgi:hypothetical protein
VLGDGVGLENLCKMSTCSLVGRISYKSLSSPPWRTGLSTTGLRFLATVRKFFISKKDGSVSPADLLKTPRCSFLPSGSLEAAALMLKRWRLAFNPDTDYFQLRHLWVLLPGLPLHFWNEEAFRAIGNSLGKLISLDSPSRSGSSRLLGRVLVEIDISTGLPETLEIDWRGRKILQKLDYLGIPFRCNRCRETGHLRRSCPGKSFSTLLDDSDDLFLNPPAYQSADPSLDFLDVPPDPCTLPPLNSRIP